MTENISNFTPDDFLSISALSHFIYCQRRCALVHIEQIWNENIFTAEGRILHEHAHEEQFEMRDGIRIERGMPLRSAKLGLSGKTDVVEFRKDETGKWLPFPVEYKHGKPKENNCDKIQLCAQAICLEEMLGVNVPAGAIFYGKTRRRMDVTFDDALRNETKETAHCLHEFIKAGKTPKAEYSKRCESCSLIELCMPKVAERTETVHSYIEEAIQCPKNS